MKTITNEITTPFGDATLDATSPEACDRLANGDALTGYCSITFQRGIVNRVPFHGVIKFCVRPNSYGVPSPHNKHFSGGYLDNFKNSHIKRFDGRKLSKSALWKLSDWAINAVHTEYKKASNLPA